MRALLVHPQFLTLGGAESVAFAMLEILEGLGVDPIVLSTEIPDAKQVYSVLNRDIQLRRTKWEIVTTPRVIIQNRTSFSRVRQAAIQRHGFNLSRGYRFAFSSYNEMAFQCAGFQYVHHPMWAPFQIMQANAIFATERGNIKSKFFDRFYLEGLKKIAGIDEKSFSKNTTVCNSFFTKRIIDNWLNIDSEVIHPALVESTKTIVTADEPRLNQAILIGRFQPDKKWIEFIPYLKAISHQFPDISIHAIGHVNDPTYLKLFKYLLDQNDIKIIFHEDATKDQVEILLRKSKFFINTKPFEHFGISIVESLNAELIPFIFGNGGATEILPIPDFHFYDVNSLVDKMRYAINNPVQIQNNLQLARRRLKIFTKDHFYKTLGESLSHFLLNKGNS
jgi:glycosyltransferase involved in cell wall biosynthesis